MYRVGRGVVLAGTMQRSGLEKIPANVHAADAVSPIYNQQPR